MKVLSILMLLLIPAGNGMYIMTQDGVQVAVCITVAGGEIACK